MSIYRKVQAVEKVFKALEKELSTFKNGTGLNCLSGCGLCCLKPDITATPLEFLPFAYELHKHDLAYQWLEDIQASETTTCKILKPMLAEGETGFCSQYKHRGLICRLFGFAASRNKMGELELATCKTIKTEFPDQYQNAKNRIKGGGQVPIMTNFYHQLRAIDTELGRQLMPINKAIEEALKVVLSYYAYRKPRRA